MQPTDVLDVLSLAHALQSHGRCCGPKAVKKMRNGREVCCSADDIDAHQWCMVGAVQGAARMLGLEIQVEDAAMDLLDHALVLRVGDQSRYYCSIAYNDARGAGDRPIHSDEKVLSLYCDAAALINPK